jgi:hypothetical protein
MAEIDRARERSRALNCRSRNSNRPRSMSAQLRDLGGGKILGPARHPVCNIPNRQLRHALIEVAWPVVPQSTPVGAQPPTDLVIRITGRLVLAIPGPMRKNRGSGGRWVGQVLPLSSRSGTSLAIQIGFGLGRVVVGSGRRDCVPVRCCRWCGPSGWNEGGEGHGRRRES